MVYIVLFIVIRLILFDNLQYTGKIKPKTLLTRLPNIELDQNKYSIIMTTYRGRQGNLNEILTKYLCDHSKYLSKVYLLWNDFHRDYPPISEMDLNLTCQRKHPVDIYDTIYRNVSCRFLIPDTLDTQYIFNIDDDFVVELKHIDRMFEIFKEQNITNQIFGNYPRSYTTAKYLIGNRYPYNFILIGFSFSNAKYWEKFFEPPLQPARDYLARVQNCDDLLMNFVVANHSGLPPVACKIPYREIVKKGEGISKKKNFLPVRKDFLRFLFNYTGTNDTMFKFNKQKFVIK